MDQALLAALGFVVLFVLLICGWQVGIALALVGFIGCIVIFGGFAGGLKVLLTTPYFTALNYTLIVLPFFALMGLFAMHAGLAEELYRAADKWVGKLPGGLAIATSLAECAFGAACGSSYASASVFTKVSLKPMVEAGYEPQFAAAVIASTSALSVLIPPSLMFVIYGVLTEQSIAVLLIAGIVPGVLLTAAFALVIWAMVVRKPSLAPIVTTRYSFREKLDSLRGLWMIILLASLIMGGIYGGVFTATEAGATGAFGALIIIFIQRRFNWRMLKNSLLDTVEFTAQVFLILIGAFIFSKFLVLTGVSSELSDFLMASALPGTVIIIIVILVYIFLGCFMDGIAILSITIPMIFPVIKALGYDPIWFGVVIIVIVELGLITPPFGMSVFIVKAGATIPLTTGGIFRGALPLYIAYFITTALLIAFPQIVLLLPSMMGK